MSAYRKPRFSTVAFAYIFLALVVMAWFVKIAAFLVVVLVGCLVVDFVSSWRRRKAAKR